MADITVYPDTFELALTLETPTLPGATHTEYPATFELELSLKTPAVVCPFPRITRTPNLNFRAEPTDEGILIGSTASGYPVVNKTATFAPIDFEHEMPCVPDADKILIMDFYEANKDNSFPWYNAQDEMVYEIIFVSKPKCRLAGRGDLWNMFFHFRQAEP